MKGYIPDFAFEATNVYRTRNFIVKQVLCVKLNHEENNAVISFDTYYARTRKRDEEYEILYCSRKRINGKRLPTTMYTRTYID